MATVASIKGLADIMAAVVMIYKAAKDISNLPIMYQDIYTRLPMIQELLERALAALEGEGEYSAVRSRQVSSQMLESCSKKALTLKAILEDLIRISNSPSFMRNLTYATKTVQYARKVNKLFDTILYDIQLLGAFYLIKMATQM
ncbi:hypothetical protein GGI35DRAFT_480617 [Trichoderma velutinum]